MHSLIKNLKEIKFSNTDQKGLALDLENATPLEINMYIGYMCNKISASELFNPFAYIVKDNKLIFSGMAGITTIVPDYYHNHQECFLQLSLFNIAIVSCPKQNAYIGAKMTVIDGQIVQDEKYKHLNSVSKYINEAGLLALINYLESKSGEQKLIDLFEEKKRIDEI